MLPIIFFSKKTIEMISKRQKRPIYHLKQNKTRFEFNAGAFLPRNAPEKKILTLVEQKVQLNNELLPVIRQIENEKPATDIGDSFILSRLYY